MALSTKCEIHDWNWAADDDMGCPVCFGIKGERERNLQILEHKLAEAVGRRSKKLTVGELNDVIDEIAFSDKVEFDRDTEKMDYSDFVTIKITKVKYMGEPTHWEVDIDDGESGGTGPTFVGMIDIALDIIQGEHGENEWHKFDANARYRK